MAFNKVILLGNLTRDVELKATAGGNQVANFSIAVNRVYNDKSGQRQEEVAFIECEAWGRTAETIEKYVKKGQQLMVEGRLRQDSWDDKDTGKKRTQLRVVVEGFSFVGSRGGDSSAITADKETSAIAAAKETVAKVAEISDDPINIDDIPF